MSCITKCLTGDDKINTLSLKGTDKTEDYHHKSTGMTCKSSSFFAKTIMIVGTATLGVAATQASHIPSDWIQMSQFLAYNNPIDETAANILDRLSTSTDLSVVIAGVTTFLSFVSFIASVRPVAKKSQYFIDVLCYTISCCLCTFMFFRLLTNVVDFQSHCSNTLPGVQDNPTMHPGAPGYDAFCDGCVHRIWIIFILYGGLMGSTGIAWLSNWCGLLCKCCISQKSNGD